MKNNPSIIPLAIMLSCFSLCFSGCFSGLDDIGNVGGGSWGFTPMSIPVYTPRGQASLTIDSVTSIKSTEVTLAFSVFFDPDSTLILTHTNVYYNKAMDGSKTKRVFLTGPDTVNFSSNKPHNFQIKVNNLMPNNAYFFYAVRYYIYKQKIDSTDCQGVAEACWIGEKTKP